MSNTTVSVNTPLPDHTSVLSDKDVSDEDAIQRYRPQPIRPVTIIFFIILAF